METEKQGLSSRFIEKRDRRAAVVLRTIEAVVVVAQTGTTMEVQITGMALLFCLAALVLIRDLLHR